MAKSCALQSLIYCIELPAIVNFKQRQEACGADGVLHVAKMMESSDIFNGVRYLRLGAGPELLPPIEAVKAQLHRAKAIPIFKISFDEPVCSCLCSSRCRCRHCRCAFCIAHGRSVRRMPHIRGH